MRAILATVICLAGLAADIWSTSRNLALGGEEANPIMGRDLGTIAWRMAAITAAVLLVCAAVEPESVASLAVILGGLHLVYGGINTYLFHRALGRWPWA